MIKETIKYKFPDNSIRKVYIYLPENYDSNSKLNTLYIFDAQSVIFSKDNWDIENAIAKKII